MFSKVLTASVLTRASDEDLCSQFNYMWTACLVASMGVLITLVQYVGNPIYCWCPAEMPQVQCNYTMTLCWVKENYYVSENEMIQFEEKDRHNLTVTYYPWVPWILLLMAAILNLPHIVWQSFASSSGLDLKKFIHLADSHESAENLAKIFRIWQLRTNSAQMNMINNVKRVLGSLGLFRLGKRHKTYLCGLVLLVKLSYLLISVGLHLSLNVFIDESFLYYGFEVVNNFLQGVPQNSMRFPKQTICDMKIRQMSNIHTYSIQCLLPINLFNEKIFIFLWFWIPILIIINTYSVMKWMYQLLSPARRWEFVEGYVFILFHLLKRKQAQPESDCPQFSNKNDIVSREEKSTDSTFSGDEIVHISEIYLDHKQQRQRTNSRAGNHGDRYVRNLRVPTLNKYKRRQKPDIETTEFEIMDAARKKNIRRITEKMLKYLGNDGVVVFRILEDSVGIVTANEIFQELYEQIQRESHHL